jgi:hypothetical protein
LVEEVGLVDVDVDVDAAVAVAVAVEGDDDDDAVSELASTSRSYDVILAAPSLSPSVSTATLLRALLLATGREFAYARAV